MASQIIALMLACVVWAASAPAQVQTNEPDTRAGRIAAQQREKAGQLKPYEPPKAEQWVKKIQQTFQLGAVKWHPFFDSAYAGGGFTLGVGHATYLGGYNTLDVRGSYTIKGYTRVEAEYRDPRVFGRRGSLSLLGGWREATQVGFYGTGTAGTSADSRANYSFRQPYTSATLDFRPTRKWLLLTGGVEYSQWEQRPGEGRAPSIEEVYTPETLPGLGSKLQYLHTLAAAGIDTRQAADYARRGGYYGATWHVFDEDGGDYDFQQVDYEVLQHVPVLRDAWVLSFRGKVVTTSTDDDATIPFFMLPGIGGGSSLRGFSSWRFRDRHSLLLQAEWRALVNSFLDVAVFYDAGKVVARRSDLDLEGLKSDYGIGFRFHGPAVTPLRIELAKSNEGLVLVFSAHSVF